VVNRLVWIPGFACLVQKILVSVKWANIFSSLCMAVGLLCVSSACLFIGQGTHSHDMMCQVWRSADTTQSSHAVSQNAAAASCLSFYIYLHSVWNNRLQRRLWGCSKEMEPNYITSKHQTPMLTKQMPPTPSLFNTFNIVHTWIINIQTNLWQNHHPGSMLKSLNQHKLLKRVESDP
jgi:hypothetical protein